MDKVKNADIVSVEYVGKLDDGEIFDSSKEGGVLNFKVGSGEVLKKFEEAIIGMTINEEKSIKIESSDAYGEYDDKKTIMAKISDFQEGAEIVAGLPIYMRLEDGNVAPAIVEDVNGDDVKINYNHPLAGQNLNFDLKVVGINAISEEELYAEHCGCGCDDDDCDCDDDDCGCGHDGCGCH